MVEEKKGSGAGWAILGIAVAGGLALAIYLATRPAKATPPTPPIPPTPTPPEQDFCYATIVQLPMIIAVRVPKDNGIYPSQVNARIPVEGLFNMTTSWLNGKMAIDNVIRNVQYSGQLEPYCSEAIITTPNATPNARRLCGLKFNSIESVAYLASKFGAPYTIGIMEE